MDPGCPQGVGQGWRSNELERSVDAVAKDRSHLFGHLAVVDDDMINADVAESVGFGRVPGG